MTEPAESEDPGGGGIMRMAIIIVLVTALVVVPLVLAALRDPVRKAPASVEQAPMPEGDLPFGLSSKATPSDLLVSSKESSPDQGVYGLWGVPKPSPLFESYSVTYFDGVGICFIRAFDEIGNNDALGIETQSAIERIAAGLTEKYGKPTSSIDVCGGSVICEQRFWDHALKEGSRIYGYQWDKLNTKSPIRSIWLEAVGMRTGTYVRLTYRLGDEQKCKAARLKADSSSL